MDYQKQKILAMALGGTFVVAAGVLGYLLYDVASQKDEAIERRDGETSAFQRYNAAPVFPSLKSIASVRTNVAELVAWRATAYERVKVGDRTFPEETAPIFKQRLQREVRRLVELPGGVEGKLAQPAFLFGFDKYLGENGVLPAAEDLPTLALDLDTASVFATLLSEAGVAEVTRCQAVEQVRAENAEEDETKARQNKKKNAKKSAREPEGPKMTSRTYALAFTARPDALVKMLNAFVSSPRFLTIRDFAFKETADSILTKFAADEEAKQKKAEAARAGSSESRRRRRRGAAAEEDAFKSGETPKQDRLVVDPELEAPLSVSCTVTVHDFGSATASAVPAAPVEAKGSK